MNKILVVDDDIDNLTVLQVMLSAYDFVVEPVKRWKEVFERIKRFNPSLILMSAPLQMQDGRNLSKLIKSDPLCKHIPIIIFSSDILVSKTVVECLADDFILKPFNKTDMLTKITKQLKRLHPNGNGHH